jgi:hypothetical protein
MKKLILILCVAVTLTGCSRGCSKMERSFEVGERDYEITMFSGGDTVFYDSFRGIVNNSEASDGVFYFKGEALIEVSGDYVITSKE